MTDPDNPIDDPGLSDPNPKDVDDVEDIDELRAMVVSLHEQNETLRSRLEGPESRAVEAMSAHTGLPEDTVRSKFDFSECIETLEAADVDPFAPDASAGDPAGGGGSGGDGAPSWNPDPQTGDGGGSVGSTSSPPTAEEKGKIEALEKQRSLLDGRGGYEEHVETIDSQLAELKGGN